MRNPPPSPPDARTAASEDTRAFREYMGDQPLPGCVVHPRVVRLPPGRGVLALPFAEL